MKRLRISEQKRKSGNPSRMIWARSMALASERERVREEVVEDDEEGSLLD